MIKNLYPIQPNRLRSHHNPRARHPRRRTVPKLTLLEPRTLLAATALLDIVNGILTYTASSGVANHLTIKSTALTTSPGAPSTSNQYSFNDTGENIQLGPGAVAAGWTGSLTPTVVGIDSKISAIVIDTGDGNDTVAIQGVNEPTTVEFTNNPSAQDSVVIGQSSKGAQNIEGDVTITNQLGTTNLTVSDVGDGSPKSAIVSGGVVLDLAPHPINYAAANISVLSLVGGATLTVNANKEGPVLVTPGAATGSGTIAIDSDPPIQYANFSALNIINAADQPLTVSNNQNIGTTTGDTAREGKAFTYQAASFTDTDPFAKPGTFLAMVNWGDGSTNTPGAIASSGPENFIVTGNHTYNEQGTFTVTVTITDTGDGGTTVIGGIPVAVSDLGGGVAVTGTFSVGNLVSNGPFNPSHVDPNLINAWGIAAGPGTALGVADTRTGFATFYDGTGAATSALGSTPSPASIAIPSHASPRAPGSPTGIVYNSSTGFVVAGAPASFLFDTLDGTISAWNTNTGAKAVIMVNNAPSAAVYTGLTLAVNGGQTDLYAADYHLGVVEIYDPSFQMIGTFTDPSLPSGYVPYNVANINGDIYVTFVKQGPNPPNPVVGAGLGYVDVFSPSGTLLDQLISGAPLNAPYGLAVAPAGFGAFAGDLLVGNSGDGLINAFDPATGAFAGTLEAVTSTALSLDGLKGLLVGQGGTAGDPGSLYFVSGPNHGVSGLFGVVSYVNPKSPVTSNSVNTVNVADAAIKGTVTNIKAIEGSTFIGQIGTIADDNPNAPLTDFTKHGGKIVVDWGDNSLPNTVGDGFVSIKAADTPGSSFLIFGAHQYAEENTSGYPYVITVTITDEGRATATVYGTATVADADLTAAAASFTTIEGSTIPAGTIVGSFLDSNPLATFLDYSSVTIDLAGGTTKQAGLVVPTLIAGLFQVRTTADVAYAHAGVFVSTISVTDLGGKKDSANAIITVGQAVLDLSTPALNATEGKKFSDDVATFTENPLSKPGNFLATIDWGDGNVTTGAIKEDASGVYHVSGSNTYEQDGDYTLMVTVVDTDIASAPVTVSQTGDATVDDADLKAKVVEPTLTEDVAFAGKVATFTDANPFSLIGDFSAQIVWSDNVTQIVTQAFGGITISPADPAEYEVNAVHPAVADPTTLSFVVTISDVQGTSKVSVSGTAKVKAANLLKATATALTITPTEGEQLPLLPGGVTVATFTDAGNSVINAQNYTATVDWGDGSTSDFGLILPPAAGGTVYKVVDTHLYSEAGTFTIDVTVSDNRGDKSSSVSTSITVADAALTNIPLGIIKGTAGVPLINQYVASFSDGYLKAPVSDYSGTIDWADGSLVTAAVFVKGDNGDFIDVTGTHTYAKEGVYATTITITDVDGKTLTIDPEIDIADAPITVEEAPVVATEGKPFTQTVVTIHDTDPTATTSDFTSANGKITIDWGDGGTSTVGDGTATIAIVPPASTSLPSNGVTFIVTGTHTYNDDDSGSEIENYQVSVTVLDTSGSTAAVTSQASVSDPILTDPGIAVHATSGTPFLAEVAGFSSSNQNAKASQFQATILWGDGSSSPGLIEPNGAGAFQVLGSHNYSAAGSFPITVTVQDNEGHSVQDTTTATVVASSSGLPLATVVSSPSAKHLLKHKHDHAFKPHRNPHHEQHSPFKKVKQLVLTGSILSRSNGAPGMLANAPNGPHPSGLLALMLDKPKSRHRS